MKSEQIKNSNEIFKYQHRLSRNPEMRIFNYEKFKKSRDVLALSSGIFELEKEIKKCKVNKALIGRFEQYSKNDLSDILSELISYVLLESVDIDFFKSEVELRKKKYNYRIPSKPRITVLFSGGVDSLSGIYWAKREYTKDSKSKIEGIFCAHSDQAWNIHIVNFLSRRLARDKINIRKICVPPITTGGYAQLRGFLYILSAGAWMDLLKSDTLIISECGPTMYQPKFGLFDIVTMTTHPEVIKIAHQVLESLLERKIKLIIPFENMTKAEVISLAPYKDSLLTTHSCVTQRFGKHDGTCYGCIIRRLGAITAGVNDVVYDRDPIIEDGAQKENLLSLLVFSQDILMNYNDMPLYEIENIEAYEKKDLFYRFALDNIAAIHILHKKGVRKIKEVDNIYFECLEALGSDVFDKRIEDVRKKISK